MSNVSIFEKKWLDLVFQDKNQNYGAYQLRLNSERTTFIAFLFGIGFLISGTFILSSFSTIPDKKPVETPIVDIIHVVKVHEPETDIKPKVTLPKSEKQAVKTPKDTKNYQVAPIEKAVIPISTNTNTPVPKGPTSPTGTPGGTGSPAVTNVLTTITTPSNTPVKPSELDREPTFPGGMKNFYDYIGRHFEKQELNEDGETIRVLVSFVIERNGIMTDIEVTENTNDAVSKEAIRVLKSLKTKWEPGYKDKQPVRTRYTLPIVVQM